MEQFAIPGVGGIIVKSIEGVDHILLQERNKSNAPGENGLLEIPAGKIRAFESIFDALRREIREETGLEVVEILGESQSSACESNGYKVINFTPFSCSQNIEGSYPIMVFVFICYATGNLLDYSNESKNYRWVSRDELGHMLCQNPQRFYPMHLATLKKYLSSY